MPGRLDAIILAGGTPSPEEPLFAVTQGKPKALLPIGGRPMVQWVLDALDRSTRVAGVVLVGLEPGAPITFSRRLARVPNAGGMLENIQNGMQEVLRLHPQARHALLASSDIPGITSEMVDWTVDTAMQTDDDIYYSVVEQAVEERRYPGSKRTYTKFSDVTVCGGDLNVVKVTAVTEKQDLWMKLIAARKSPLKQASLLGYDLLLLLLLGRVSLARAEKLASQRLGVKGRVLLSPFAEVGMDVDKPSQYEIVRRDLEARAA